MSTIKNGGVGTLDTMGESVWDDAQDLEYYKEVHSRDEGMKDRRRYMLECIERNLDDYVETLNRAIQFLWKRPHDLDEDALSLLSVDGKIALLRKLMLERSNQIGSGLSASNGSLKPCGRFNRIIPRPAMLLAPL
jgi:hypothetical protein